MAVLLPQNEGNGYTHSSDYGGETGQRALKSGLFESVSVLLQRPAPQVPAAKVLERFFLLVTGTCMLPRALSPGNDSPAGEKMSLTGHTEGDRTDSVTLATVTAISGFHPPGPS